MSSHVPFLAVRSDEQFSSSVRKNTRDVTKTNMDSPPLVRAPPPTYAASRLPSPVRFVLLVLLSFSLSTVLKTLAANYAGLQLATASRKLEEPWQISLFIGWKVVQLTIGWVAGYDYEDIAALTLLTNQPYYYLLHAYYALPLLPLAISAFSDIIAFTLPFALLRPLIRAHDPATPRMAHGGNQALAMDTQIMVLTSALAATIYAVAFYLEHQFLHLGEFLITHFDNLATMAAHDTTVAQLIPLFAILGLAASFFLFRPTIAAAGISPLRDQKARGSLSAARAPKRFNPATATLGETFAYNLGYGTSGWSKRAEVLAKRTAVLALGTLVNNAVRVFATVDGTDIGGALGYAGIWAFASVLLGVAYGALSHEE